LPSPEDPWPKRGSCPDCEDGWGEAERYRLLDKSCVHYVAPGIQTAPRVREGVVLGTDESTLCPQCEEEKT